MDIEIKSLMMLTHLPEVITDRPHIISYEMSTFFNLSIAVSIAVSIALFTAGIFPDLCFVPARASKYDLAGQMPF